MRILQLAGYFFPEKAASIYLEENRYEAFSNAGFKTIVYAARPQRGLTEEEYQEYKHKKLEMMYNGGVEVHRFAMYREGKNAVLRAFRYFLISVVQLCKGIWDKDIDLIYVASTPPTQGALAALVKKFKKVPFVYNLQDIFPDSLAGTGLAKKDGFLYIIHKANASKAYTVFEEGSALGYKFAAQGDEATALGAVYQFEVEGEGEYNYVSTPIEWAQQEYLKEADPEFYASNWEDVEKDGVTTSTWKKIQNADAKDIQGLGVIVFPVYAESEYVFNANGSKLMLAGFAFSANDDLTIATENGVEIYKGGGETAIQGAKVVTVAGNGAIYNLAGQKVNASYKGIVIKDGKKYIQK